VGFYPARGLFVCVKVDRWHLRKLMFQETIFR
jgi:hypothetical protein